MEIAVGKYRTRGGDIAHVTELLQADRHGIIAQGQIEGSAMVCGWFSDGKWLMEGRDHERDLMHCIHDEAVSLGLGYRQASVKPKVPGVHFIEKDKNIHDFELKPEENPKHDMGAGRYEPIFQFDFEDKQKRNAIALELAKQIITGRADVKPEHVVDLAFSIAELMVVKGKM